MGVDEPPEWVGDDPELDGAVERGGVDADGAPELGDEGLAVPAGVVEPVLAVVVLEPVEAVPVDGPRRPGRCSRSARLVAGGSGDRGGRPRGLVVLFDDARAVGAGTPRLGAGGGLRDVRGCPDQRVGDQRAGGRDDRGAQHGRRAREHRSQPGGPKRQPEPGARGRRGGDCRGVGLPGRFGLCLRGIDRLVASRGRPVRREPRRGRLGRSGRGCCLAVGGGSGVTGAARYGSGVTGAAGGSCGGVEVPEVLRCLASHSSRSWPASAEASESALARSCSPDTRRRGT